MTDNVDDPTASTPSSATPDRAQLPTSTIDQLTEAGYLMRAYAELFRDELAESGWAQRVLTDETFDDYNDVLDL